MTLIPLFMLFCADTIDLNITAADSFFEIGRYSAAESLYLEAQKYAGGAALAGAEKGLGNIAFVYGRYRSAEKYYRSALSGFRAARDQRGEAKVLINLGNLFYLRGDHPAARKDYESALGIIDRLKEPGIPEQKDRLAALANLGQIDLACGKRESALAKFRTALQASREIGQPAVQAENLQNIGDFYQQSGEPDSALDYYEEACRLSMDTGHLKRCADIQREMGSIYRKTGDYDRSYNLIYQSAALMLRIKHEGYLPGEGETYNDLGLLFMDMGNIRNALASFGKGLKAFRSLGDSVGVKKAEVNLAAAFLRLAASDSVYYDSSRHHYELAHQPGDHAVDQADYCNNLGVLSESRGRFDEAQGYYQQALDRYRAAKDKLGLARVSNNLANVAMNRKDFALAARNYEAALAGIKAANRRDWEASLLANLGSAQRENGQEDLAIASFERAAQIAERLRQGIVSQEFRAQYFENKIAIFEELAGLYVQKGMAAEAFNCCERAKARAFLDLLSGVEGIGTRPDLTAEVKALILRERELEKKVEFLTGDAAQPGAIAEHDLILKTLIEAFPDYQALNTASPVSVEGLQEQLDGRTAVVEYFLGVRTGFVFVVTRDRLSVRRLDAPPRTVYEGVDSLRKAIRSRKDFTRWGRKLYDLLLAPVRPDIGRSERLCIIPHSTLHHLPFAALVVNDPPRRLLIEDFDLFYSPSASVYGLARGKGRGKPARSAVFAKSNFDDHPEWFDLPLPGTNAEKESLLAARVLPGVAVFSDAAGEQPPSEANVKLRAGEFDLLHFATHGKLDPDSPMDSRIILSRDSVEDGSLRVREIFGLKLNAYLVTMSACQTGQLKGFNGAGKYSPGDEMTGLSRAFIYAGASSVVASLWMVSDAATVLLMVDFYKNLKGLDKTAALCAAQRKLMKSEYYADPFFWAPFVVIGDGD